MIRTFDLSDILTITTGGRLVSTRGMKGVYDILGHLTGESIFTTKIPRAIEWAQPQLLALFPELSDATVVSLDAALFEVPREKRGATCHAWVDLQRERLGNSRDVDQLDGWESINPIAEAIAMNTRDGSLQ